MDVGLVFIIVWLGLADSLNPVTIAVAALLAATERPVRRLAGFVAGIFSVYLLGGLVLTLGPGELLDTWSRGSSEGGTVRHVVLLVVGLAAIGFGGWLFVHRDAGREKLPDLAIGPRSAFGLGAGMTLVDLPTAFPYFAAIAAIVGRDVGDLSAIALLVVFNLMYVVPILLMLVAAVALQERAAPALVRVRDSVARWSPLVLSVVTLLVGIALVADSVRGLSG